MVIFICWDFTKTNLTFLCECFHWPLSGARRVDNLRLSLNSDKVAGPPLTSSMPPNSNVQRQWILFSGHHPLSQIRGTLKLNCFWSIPTIWSRAWHTLLSTLTFHGNLSAGKSVTCLLPWRQLQKRSPYVCSKTPWLSLLTDLLYQFQKADRTGSEPLLKRIKTNIKRC